MSATRAPWLAAWMLEHLVPGDRNEALEGDLLEELCAGRSSNWYWRQMFGSIAAAWRSEIADHRSALVFATVWSMLAPVWMAVVHTRGFVEMATNARRLAWPWSAVCPVGLWMSLVMAFLWTGLLLFLWWARLSSRRFDSRSFGRGFVWGSLIVMPVWLAIALLNALLQANSRVVALSGFFPFFVATLCGVWSVMRIMEIERDDGGMSEVGEPDSGRVTELWGRRR
jgi:hypothetical protein